MLYALFCLSLSTPPPSPTPVRLADLVEEVRRKNPEIRAAREQARADRLVAGSAGALDDPMLMVQLWNMPVDLSTVPVMVNVTPGHSPRRKARGATRRGGGHGGRRRAPRSPRARAMSRRSSPGRTSICSWPTGRSPSTTRSAERSQSLIVGSVVPGGRRAWGDVGGAAGRERGAQGRSRTAKRRTRGAPPPCRSWWRCSIGRRAPTSAGPPSRASWRACRHRRRCARWRCASDPSCPPRAPPRPPRQRACSLAKAAPTPDLGVSLGAMHMFGGTAPPSDFLFLGAQVRPSDLRRQESSSRIASARGGRRCDRARRRTRCRTGSSPRSRTRFAEVQAETRQTELHHRLIPLAAASAGGRARFVQRRARRVRAGARRRARAPDARAGSGDSPRRLCATPDRARTRRRLRHRSSARGRIWSSRRPRGIAMNRILSAALLTRCSFPLRPARASRTPSVPAISRSRSPSRPIRRRPARTNSWSR